MLLKEYRAKKGDKKRNIKVNDKAMEDRDNYKFFARTPGDDGKRSVHCTDIFGCQCRMGDALNSLIFELLEEYCGLPLALSTILCK